MNKLEEFEKKLGSLALELEELKAEAVQNEEWPKVGCEYFYWNNYSGSDLIESSNWQKMKTDGMRLNVGNVHRTKEEAEAYRDWLTNPRTQARRRVEMCDGLDSIGMNQIVQTNGAIKVRELPLNWINSGLCFTTIDQAQACIDLLGEDVIKLALWVES